jgi:predicted ferric reductase
MSAIDLSSYFGLTAMTLLTFNILIGLVMSVKYNPVRNWPHRRINTFKIHNWTAYIALAVAALHPVIILFSSTAKFSLIDILYPVNAPKQPWINVLGALALYSLTFVVVTSYFRRELGRKTWKTLHFTAYGTAILLYFHGIFTDPNLKDAPIDFLDGEKVYVELCFLIVLAAAALRLRWQLKQPPPRVHRRKLREGGGGRREARSLRDN